MMSSSDLEETVCAQLTLSELLLLSRSINLASFPLGWCSGRGDDGLGNVSGYRYHRYRGDLYLRRGSLGRSNVDRGCVARRAGLAGRGAGRRNWFSRCRG